MPLIGGVSCKNGVIGNRLTKGTASYGWDVLNRMTSYAYRSDGMWVSKSDSTGSAVYRYDGQMLMQDVETPTSGTQTVTNYALGARGVDAVSKQDGADPAVVGYPIYDAHGNRVATLVKSGTSFSLTDVRTCDAWGNVRVGAQTGRPRARYCATLGHVQDDESGLVYMRARYYEPTSDRFVSQDPSRHGSNWFAHCSNDPVNRMDASGNADFWGVIGVIALVSDIIAAVVTVVMLAADMAILWPVVLVVVLTAIVCLDWKHTTETLKGIFTNLGEEMKRRYIVEGGVVQMIEPVVELMKTQGSFIDKLSGAMLEQAIYCADALES